MSDTAGGSAGAPPETALEHREKRFSFVNDRILVTTTKGKETFSFRIPSIGEYAEIGARAGAIRRRKDPDRIGMLATIDMQTANMIWGFALFETLLDNTSAQWVYSANSVDGKPVVDHNKFPLNKMDDFMEVVNKVDEALERFRDRGPVDPEPVSAKAMGA